MYDETIDYKGYQISVMVDDSAQSPQEWQDDQMFLVGFHRQFWVEAKGVFTKESEFSEWLDFVQGNLEKDHHEYERFTELMAKYHFFPLSAYIHSGVHLYLGTDKVDQWDSCMVGGVFIAIDYGGTRSAQDYAKGLVDEWNDYLSGNVYGFKVEDKNGFDVDSCWGFYGDPKESGLLDQAKDAVDYDIRKKQQAHEQKLKVQIKNKVPLNVRSN